MPKLGVDLSNHQRGIDLRQLKNEGVEFIILRGGYTGWGTGVNYNKDSCFEMWYDEAKALGIPVGCYYYSCANTYSKGVAEATFLYENCLKNHQFEYPIYIDVEDEHWQKSSKYLTTDAIKGFCETLESKGFYVGIYASVDWFRNRIVTSDLTQYDKWVARWSKSRPKEPYGGLWQFGGGTNMIRSTKMAGFTVDQNYSYKDYPNIIKKAKLNGYGDRKSIDELAREVIEGKWGNAPERRIKLTKAGYDYAEVQKRVNEMLKAK